MRLAFVIACVAVGGCAREQPAATEVDLNAAAVQAEGDIANYAAGHPARSRHRPPGSLTADRPGEHRAD